MYFNVGCSTVECAITIKLTGKLTVPAWDGSVNVAGSGGWKFGGTSNTLSKSVDAQGNTIIKVVSQGWQFRGATRLYRDQAVLTFFIKKGTTTGTVAVSFSTFIGVYPPSGNPMPLTSGYLNFGG